MTTTSAASTVEVGTVLPPLTLPRISRTTLALFAGSSGDHNPIHIDLDVAKSAGLDDVFAHGMLSMAYAGEELLLSPRITDLYEKKGGALEFLVKETEVTRSDGSKVASLKTVTVIQNPAPKNPEAAK